MDSTSTSPISLYTYYRSSCSWRVRIALLFKQLPFQSKFINILKGDQHSPEYDQINPSHLVPAIEIDGKVFTQSIAILEYLEETRPQIPLLPKSPEDRAMVRSMTLLISSEIQPIQNMRVLRYFISHFPEHEQEQKRVAWAQQWIHQGFLGLESLVKKHSKDFRYCFGDSMTLVDCCLVPQMYNAFRFQMDMTPYPNLKMIYQHLRTLEVIQKSSPEQQWDCPDRQVTK